MGALLFPIWKIELIAPQYPEGLTLKIWADKLSGDIDIVNGLNHYIGMKKLKQDEFVEFKVLPGLLIFFSLFGVIVGVLNKRKYLYLWMGVFITFALFSMADFYYWEYNYGHNLDPTAPIQVPGMAYQPPLIGYKQMLNFYAFSIPDIGGWFFIGSGFLMFIICILEWKKGKIVNLKQTSVSMSLVLLLIAFTSCKTEMQPINYGKDDCDYCKMIILDNKFSVEIISQKGKIFMMDDLECARQFINSGSIDINEIKEIYISNFIGENELIDWNQSFLVKNDILKSPMGGNLAAFSSEKDANNYIFSKGGKLITSQSVIELK